MRFIRIFSELSGQIKLCRFQKRCFIEMALIKLCRPADGDRRRIASGADPDELEKAGVRYEGGASDTAGDSGASAGSLATGRGACRWTDIHGRPRRSFGMDALSLEEQAAPDEICQGVMSMWPSIVAQTTGRVKMTLISAVPKYNARRRG